MFDIILIDSLHVLMYFSLGSIIRCMRRLEEALRQMCQAAKSIGSTDLENKFAEGWCVLYYMLYPTVIC